MNPPGFASRVGGGPLLMKRSLLAVSLLGVLLAAGGLVFVRSRQPAASPSAAVGPVAPAPVVAPAPEDPLLAGLDCLASTPPRCKVRGSAAAFGPEGTRILLRDLAGHLAGCRAGDAQACASVGQIYEQGVIVDASPDKAAPLYERACGKGLSRGCFLLRDLYRQAKGVPRDDVRAKALQQRILELDCAEDPTASGCDALLASRRDGPDAGPGTAAPMEAAKASPPAREPAASCDSLAIHIQYERDEARLKEAFAGIEHCLKPLCDANDAACASPGKPGGVDSASGVDSTPERYVYLQKLCDAGHPDSCHGLARAHDIGGILNPKAAMRSLLERRTDSLRLDERACALGSGYSCAQVGKAYESGFPVTAELERALDAYTRECELNGPEGCEKEASLAGAVEPERVALAMLRARVNYEDGCDPENAATWCKRAADLYAGRSGLDADPARSAELYRQAVPGLESGCDTDADACRGLIELYEQGLGGLERDEDKLRELRQKLCSHTMDCEEPETETEEEEVSEPEPASEPALASDEEAGDPEPSSDDSEME